MNFFSFITTLMLFSVFAFATNQTNESATTQTSNQGESLASETNSNEQSQDKILLIEEDGSACANCIIDIYPYEIDIYPYEFYPVAEITETLRLRDIEEVILDVGNVRNTISLDLMFNLNLNRLTFVGQSDERSFDDTDFNMQDTVTGIIREAVRDGYKKLNQFLVDSDLPESSNIIVDISGNQVKIGQSDYIQEGDVFYIYDREDYNYNPSCISRDGFKPHLAIASVVDINGRQSTLQIDEVNSGCKQIQVGDIAALSLESKVLKYEQAAQKEKRSLRIGFLPRIILLYRGGFRFGWARDISPIIEEALLDEAGEFGFQINDDMFM